MTGSVKVVLSGSGMLYPLHAGALWALSDAGYEIEAVTGVSGGAVVAAALASGYTPGPELNNLVLDTLPGLNGLIDPSWCPFLSWGLIRGDRIQKVLSNTMTDQFFNTQIPLRVYTVNLDSQVRTEPPYNVFGTTETPMMNVATAVRASLSIPFIFKPVKIDGDRHVDGGVAANFPLNTWGEGEGVVGFHVRGTEEHQSPNSLFSYARSLIEVMMRAINREHIEDAVFARTVVLNGGISPLDFGIDRKDAQQLIETGYRTVEEKFPFQ